jgi:polyphosphate glucokinase
MTIVGVDVGGSGIKGAPVDVAEGRLAEERYRLETPQPSDVARVVDTVAQVAQRFGKADRIGVTFPGVVVDGVVRTAANVDKSWIDTDAAELFGKAIGVPVTVINDADAAGVAEVTFGAGCGQPGTTIMLTFGTGIGSAVFLDGKLLRNTELGHLELHGEDAEVRASDRARDVENLEWHEWAQRVQKYLRHVERLFQPDLFIIGGGVSKKAEKFLPYIDVHTRIVPAALQNNAGIIGAALATSGPI